MELFVDDLTHIDFSYLHPDRGLLGETWRAHVRVPGELDEQGMIVDFGIVKPTLKRWLDDTVDHSLVVAADAPNLTLRENGAMIDLRWQLSTGRYLECRAPAAAISLIPTDRITEANLSAWCEQQLRDRLPNLALYFEPELIPGAYYHYSHGLKKHQGNCQRIAHGHRSQVRIWCNGERHEETEHWWAEQWRDIYLGTREDLQETFIDGDIEYHRFAYRAQQGEFALTLPSEHCYLVDTDSTVEWIGQHILQRLQARWPRDQWKVQAYEGISKGVVVSG